jgi:polyisoprenoid-binding protein YceI
MKIRTIPALAAVLVLAVFSAPRAEAAENYAIDYAHSSIGFAVKHFGISTVRGEFKEYSGELMIDEANLADSSVSIEVTVASIDTSNEKRDGHLESADFFDAENHPKLTFESTKIEKTGEGEFMVTGNLTIRGTTKEIQMPVTVGGPLEAMGSVRVGVEGQTTINRQDYGLAWSKLLETGGLVVADDVKITFSLEASRPVEAEGTQG